MGAYLEEPSRCMPLGTQLQVSDRESKAHPCTSGSDGQRIIRSTTRRNKTEVLQREPIRH